MLGIFMQEVTSLAHYSSVITNQLLWWVALAPTYRIGLENIVARLGTYDGWKDFLPMYHWVNFSWFQNVIQPYGWVCFYIYHPTRASIVLPSWEET